MSTAEQHPQDPPTLADALDENVRTNVRVLIALKGVNRPTLYRALEMSRQSFGARLNGPTRFTAAEVRILAYLLRESTDTLYMDPDELVRRSQEAPGETPTEPTTARLEQEMGWARSRCLSASDLADGLDVIGQTRELPGQRQLAIPDHSQTGGPSGPYRLALA